MSPPRNRRDALELLDEWFPPTPEERVAREEAYCELLVSHLIYKARTEARLTQAQLAERVGTSRTAIARLEDQEYQGHSLTMLRRVADALGKRVVVRLEDKEPAEEDEATRAEIARKVPAWNARGEQHAMGENSGLKPGNPASQSGQYQEIGPRGGESGRREVTSTEGKPPPPTSQPKATYRLSDKTNNPTAKR